MLVRPKRQTEARGDAWAAAAAVGDENVDPESGLGSKKRATAKATDKTTVSAAAGAAAMTVSNKCPSSTQQKIGESAKGKVVSAFEPIDLTSDNDDDDAFASLPSMSQKQQQQQKKKEYLKPFGANSKDVPSSAAKLGRPSQQQSLLSFTKSGTGASSSVAAASAAACNSKSSKPAGVISRTHDILTIDDDDDSQAFISIFHKAPYGSSTAKRQAERQAENVASEYPAAAAAVRSRKSR